MVCQSRTRPSSTSAICRPAAREDVPKCQSHSIKMEQKEQQSGRLEGRLRVTRHPGRLRCRWTTTTMKWTWTIRTATRAFTQCDGLPLTIQVRGVTMLRPNRGGPSTFTRLVPLTSSTWGRSSSITRAVGSGGSGARPRLQSRWRKLEWRTRPRGTRFGWQRWQETNHIGTAAAATGCSVWTRRGDGTPTFCL